MKTIILFCVCGLLLTQNSHAQSPEPVKMAVIGLSHDHVGWVFNRPDKGDMEVVAIVEPNKVLRDRFQKIYNLQEKLLFASIEEMLAHVKPEAVMGFGPIYDHLAIVQHCAPLGIHVMVEKPLAVSKAHALEMETLAKEHQIHLITNYETTWYASNHQAYQMVKDPSKIGDIRKIVIHDGHEGPQEIGVSKEFLEWLTDPVQNGGGAVIDFGCYGANLSTWLMDGEKPVSVTAVLQQIKPEIYPKVDDEATIILEYPNAQTIIQASWNWPFSRKDMEIYGQHGYVIAKTGKEMAVRLEGERTENIHQLEARAYPYDDPFSFFSALVKGDISISDKDLSSLQNNKIVVEILEAAKESARTGEKVLLEP